MTKRKTVDDASLTTVSKQTAGGVTGAVLGGMLGGPVGALVGGVAGTIVGDASAKGQKPMQRAARKISSLRKSVKGAAVSAPKRKRSKGSGKKSS